MNLLVEFIKRLLGLGDASLVEKLVKGVLLGKSQPAADGSAPAGNPLEDLMAKFKDKGLGSIFASWVGTGKNDAITPDQVKDGVGENQLAAMAKQAGIPTDVLAEKLSKYLPGLIDKMTPGGKIPTAG